jgi:hypothetical protein
MRVLFAVILIFFAGCGTAGVSCQDDSLVSAVRSETEARALVLREIDSSTLPDEPRRSMEMWVTEEVRKLFASKGEAEIWYFKESKGGLGWRKGLAAVAECQRTAEFEFSDDN